MFSGFCLAFFSALREKILKSISRPFAAAHSRRKGAKSFLILGLTPKKSLVWLLPIIFLCDFAALRENSFTGFNIRSDQILSAAKYGFLPLTLPCQKFILRFAN